jgi:hypothetical protein
MATAIILFIGCTLLNVVLATIKSVMTIKGSKASAAVWNALSFGLYAYIVILTANAPITTFWKVFITAACNLVGVYGVKLVEERMRKDKMWKLEMTVRNEEVENLHKLLSTAGIPNHYLTAGKHTVFNCYCETKEQTDKAMKCGEICQAKTFASETTLSP